MTSITASPSGTRPEPRGPLSEALLAYLSGRSVRLGTRAWAEALAADTDVLWSDDVQLALHLAYELHYRGVAGCVLDAEWDTAVLSFRAGLEDAFEAALCEAVPQVDVAPAEVGDRLVAALDGDGPSLSAFVAERGELAHLREFAVHRSIYQLREADGHTWAIPRFAGPARAALIEIQMDEYGAGIVGRSHAELFAATMRSLRLDDRYGAYLDVVPGTTLATTNLLSYLALHRRHLGAVVGHLAGFEMTSVEPMSRYAAACERLGLPRRAREFYDVHVEADRHHGPLALGRMVTHYVAGVPERARAVVWGASLLADVERRFAERLLAAWQSGASSLLEPARRSMPPVMERTASPGRPADRLAGRPGRHLELVGGSLA